MEIRQVSENDIPAIVELLKLSLGEGLMPKSVAFWRWKHIDNPFGQSPVLLAFDGARLIGVRAFMRWQWRTGTRIYRSVRAVDTAVHPEYQGTGIFKTLTQQLVDECKKEEIDFIYNTPNKDSKPGYLKMGWKEFGRMKIMIRLRLNFSSQSRTFESRYGQFPQAQVIDGQDVTTLSDTLVTDVSDAFVIWRYVRNPNVRYFSFCDEKKTYFLIFRLKRSILGQEFRICDLFMKNGADLEALEHHLFQVAGESSSTYITFSGSPLPIRAMGLKIGPMVTVRELSIRTPFSKYNWRPSLGDMEVF